MKSLTPRTKSSRVFLFGNIQRAAVSLVLLALVPANAVAQYGGGGTGGNTYPAGYGSKGAVIGGVVAGAAAGAALLYWKFHKRAKLQGCLSDGGNTLVSAKNNQTYKLTNTQNKTLRPGEHVELLGKITKDDSGEPTFEVYRMSKDLGQCTTTTAEQRQ